MRYRREVDGLRSVAVIPVILFHAGLPSFSGGFVGVDVFFVISGYLITSLIISERQAGVFSLARFYERRARRILPALFLVLLVCVPFAWTWMLPPDLAAFSASLLAVPLFVSNILFWRETGSLGGYFDATEGLRTLLHTWSLAVEEQYYLLFPLFLLLIWRRRRRWVLLTLGVLAIGSLALAQWLSRLHPTLGFYLLPTRGWELLIGVLIAMSLADGRELAMNRLVRELAAIAGLLLIAYAVVAYSEDTPFPGFYALVPTLGAALVIVAATPSTAVGALLGTRPLVGIGLISYSAYLWHQPLFSFARLRSVLPPGRPLLLALALAAFALAFLSWRYVERPFRNSQRIDRRQLIFACVLGAVCLFGFGLAGKLSGGAPQRLGAWRPTWQRIAAVKTVREARCDKQRRSAVQLANGDLCVMGSAALPSMAVIGDSHAAALFEELAASPSMASTSFYAVSGGWCAPLANDFRMPDFGSTDCPETTRAALAQIANRASVDTVVLVAEWANYTQGSRDNGTGVQLKPGLCEDQDGRAASVADNPHVVQRALQATIDLLRDHGKRVLIVEPTPEFHVKVMDYIAKLAFFTRSSNLSAIGPTITTAEYQRRTAEVFEVFRRLHGAQFVATPQLFCGQHDCSSIDAAGNILFSDSNHLSNYGARLVVRQLEQRKSDP